MTAYPTPAAPDDHKSPYATALVLLVIGLYASVIVVPRGLPTILVALASLGIVAFAAAEREHDVLQVALPFALCVTWVASNAPPIWPLHFAVPLIAYAIAVRFSPRLREHADFWVRGRGDTVTWGLAIATIAISSLALWAWLRFLKPDVSMIRAQIPPVGVGVLIVIGLTFSVVNALLEEVLWRGAMQTALEKTTGNVVIAVAVQAASFGVAHLYGFPRGAVGVCMAAVYGTMLGILRARSRGLFVPIVTHIFADATIFALLMRWMR